MLPLHKDMSALITYEVIFKIVLWCAILEKTIDKFIILYYNISLKKITSVNIRGCKGFDGEREPR